MTEETDEIQCMQLREWIKEENERRQKCCLGKTEICHITPGKKTVKEKSPENQWFKEAFDPVKFPFSRHLQDFYKNPSEDINKSRKLREFAEAVYFEAWKKTGQEPPKCGKHEGHILPNPRSPPPVKCCDHVFTGIRNPFDWKAHEFRRFWRGKDFVNESAEPVVPQEPSDAAVKSKTHANELTGRYFTPYGHGSRHVPIKMVTLLADEGDPVREFNLALLRLAVKAGTERMRWGVLELHELENSTPYSVQWRKYRALNQADIIITRMHQEIHIMETRLIIFALRRDV